MQLAFAFCLGIFHLCDWYAEHQMVISNNMLVYDPLWLSAWSLFSGHINIVREEKEEQGLAECH